MRWKLKPEVYVRRPVGTSRADSIEWIAWRLFALTYVGWVLMERYR